MTPSSVLASDKINLDKLCFLLVDDNPLGLDILGQVVSGFGVRGINKCASAKEAREVLQTTVVDFIIAEAQMSGEDGYDFIRWVRRNAGETNRFAPAIIITGHTRVSQIARARDCGAHFTIAKPITPRIILERIFWIGREQRLFIETDTYSGPDRRFKREGPPPGMKGRRAEDAAMEAELAKDSGPNMSQDMVNALINPTKVSL